MGTEVTHPSQSSTGCPLRYADGYSLFHRLIINDNLDTGTQLPFIERARKEGYAVVVTNTNDNHRIMYHKKKLIQVSL